MRTTTPSFNLFSRAWLLAVATTLCFGAQAQNSGSGSNNSGSGNGNGNNGNGYGNGGNGNGYVAPLPGGLSFTNPQLISGQNLKKNSVYLFSNVYSGLDARLTVVDLVNGATITKIDDNTSGLGYVRALQPEIKTPGGIRQAYATFRIDFYEAGTANSATIDNLQATALDIDGNLTLKEFCEIDMDGGLASFASATLDINVVQLLLKKFKATNILGIERNDIDTAALGNMFTVSKTNVSSFTFNYGANTIGGGSATRQFSLYVKGFNYPDEITLPVELTSFSAMLNNSKVDLKWITAMEKNVSHFIVEKSTDGKNYSDAGVVFAYGNTDAKMTYTFADNNINTAQPGVIYYRLRSVDIDTKTQLSEVRVIRIGKRNEQLLSIITYPNPVTSEVRVTVPANWQSKKIRYQVINNAGQVVMSIDNPSASQTETINVSKLQTGYYILSVSAEGEKAQQKIIKQ